MRPRTSRAPAVLPAAGLGIGLVAGAALGVATGAWPLGLLFGVGLAGAFALRPRQCSTPAAGADESGSARRALLWLVGGLGLLALAMVAVAPELLTAAPRAGAELALLVFAAAVPGLIVLALVALRRRRQHADDRE